MSDWNYLSYKDSDNYAPTSWRNYMLPWQHKCWLFGVKLPRERMLENYAEWGGDGNGMGQTLLSRAFAEGADELP